MSSNFGKWSPVRVWVQQTLIDSFDENSHIISPYFVQWKKIYQNIYPDKDLTLELFIQHTYFVLLVKYILSYQSNLRIPLLPYDFTEWAEEISEIRLKLTPYFQGIAIAMEDIFSQLYEQLVPSTTRLSLGEYYTPFVLAEKMVQETYTPGLRVLDPACGSGTFLLALVKQILSHEMDPQKQEQALQELVGMDINPIAVFVTKANIAIQVSKGNFKSITSNVLWNNFLFPSEHPISNTPDETDTVLAMNNLKGNNEFDLIIGNPPWQVLGGIYSSTYKKRLRNLAYQFGVHPRARNLPNIEISALFLYQATTNFLRNKGTIAFLVSNALINGSQHNGTRNFLGLEQIRIWRFSKDLFKIHSVCFIAKKTILSSQTHYPSITVIYHEIRNTNGNLEFFPAKPESYIPITILRHADGTRKGAEKLIPVSERKKLLPRLSTKNNGYLGRTRKGADLYPRTFVYVNILNQTQSVVLIEPNMGSQTKPPWNFRPFHQARVEQDHIFYTVKSDVCVPFLILDSTPIFLPITSQTFLNFDGTATNIPNLNARTHYEYLASLYKKRQRPGKKIQEFWGNLNFRNKLAHPAQLAPLKVVTPSSAGFVKAALIRNPATLIDVSLYYVPVSTIEEGHYLLGILNAPCVAEDVRIRSSEGAGGGVRNLHKRPWEIHIPTFNPTEGLHQAIQNLAGEMEHQAMQIAVQWREKEYQNGKNKVPTFHSVKDVPWRKLMVQKRILTKLTQEYQTLNELVYELLNS